MVTLVMMIPNMLNFYYADSWHEDSCLVDSCHENSCCDNFCQVDPFHDESYHADFCQGGGDGDSIHCMILSFRFPRNTVLSSFHSLSRNLSDLASDANFNHTNSGPIIGHFTCNSNLLFLNKSVFTSLLILGRIKGDFRFFS